MEVIFKCSKLVFSNILQNPHFRGSLGTIGMRFLKKASS